MTRHLFYPVILIVLLTSMAAVAQEATKAETEDWLNGKFNDYSTYFKISGNGWEERLRHTFVLKAGNCSCEFKNIQESNGKIHSTEVSKFDFSNMTSVKMETPFANSYPEVFRIKILSFNNLSVVNQKLIYHQDGEKIEEKKVPSLSFYIDEKDLAERAAKALQHYIKLCGGKKEKF